MLRYLFSFDGRINRAKMWLFLIGSQVLCALTLPVEKSFVRVDLPPDACAPAHHLVWPTTPLGTLAACFVLALYLVLCASAAAVVVKRLHDRNKSAWWLLFFAGVPTLFFSCISLLPSFQCAVFDGQPIGLIPFAITWLVEAWLFIELFLLRGSPGGNRFGPDPLTNTPKAAGT